jgi:hypothetical protein
VADHEHDAGELSELNFQAAFTASGRSADRIDTVTLLFGCTHEGCGTKIELVVDIAATLAIFTAHSQVHTPLKDAKALASLFGPDGQPVSAKRPGLLDT